MKHVLSSLTPSVLMCLTVLICIQLVIVTFILVKLYDGIRARCVSELHFLHIFREKIQVFII